MTQSISVVIPIYNSELVIFELVERSIKALSAITDTFEIILVNDGSRDKSWNAIQKLAANNRNISGHNLLRNFGQQNALLCGIRNSKYDLIVTMDDDLQHPPEEINKLLEKLNTGLDVVYGAPLKEPHSFWRKVSSKTTKTLLRIITNIEETKHASAFRIFRKNLKDVFKMYESPFVSVDVLLSWGTERFGVVNIEHHPRAKGFSGYTFRKLFTHAVTMLTGFSVMPLHLVSMLGFCLTFLGFLMLCYVLGRYIINGGSVPGFPFLAASLSIFSGAQMFALGIIGEYLARMHFRMMGKPIYIISESINADTCK